MMGALFGQSARFSIIGIPNLPSDPSFIHIQLRGHIGPLGSTQNSAVLLEQSGADPPLIHVYLTEYSASISKCLAFHWLASA
ncbi:hypothetical protein RSAG8_12910, partial [Rhizoctonia solani AG-8 WAC10335]